jgi:phosphoglycerol geranylgeranyltransferase
MKVLEQLQIAKRSGKKLLAILLDPEKVDVSKITEIIENIIAFNANFILVGGSVVTANKTQDLVKALKEQTSLKIILFPGDVSQISEKADALLFLSLLSGTNPEYLVSQQVKAAPILKNTCLEVIPTAYILIDGGTISSVQKQSHTQPLNPKDIDKIYHTALAGQLMGKKLIYLEAGSGAKTPIPSAIIQKVATLKIPVIVGGGISSLTAIKTAYESGANIVVIGTAFEENTLLLEAQ